MLDPDIIDPIAVAGLKLLTESGVLRKQIERNKERLLAGDPDQSPEEIAKEIKKFRFESGMLEAFHALGEEYKAKETGQ
jgi:hypothetical protein